MPTYTYRKNGGGAIGMHSAVPSGIDPTYIGIVTDPTAPDGDDLSPPKIWDGSVLRNATAGELTAIAAAEVEDLNLQDRASHKSALDNKAFLALAKIMMDEINTLRTWTRDLKTEVAGATNLADFQSRVAGMSTLNDRTGPQFRTALRNHIDTL